MQPVPRIVFIGWGAINSRVGAILQTRRTPVDIVAIATRRTTQADTRFPRGIRRLSSPDELTATKPDLVIEAAGRDAALQWAPAALAATPITILASTSVFSDDGALAGLTELAERHGNKIAIPSGAIGGMDALASASVLGLDVVLHQIVKAPVAWKATEAEKLLNLERLTERTTFFSGTARQASAIYPQNANATVATSLAGIGLDRTRVELIADPAASLNSHHITAHGAFGRMQISLENRPLATNPKSSELTALSLVRLIEHHVRPLII